MLLVPLLLEVRQETPAEETYGEFGISLSTIDFDLLDELAVLGAILRHNELLR